MASRAGLINLHEAARELGVAEVTLRGYIKRGKVPFIRMGGLIRFNKDEIARVKQEGVHIDYTRGLEVKKDESINN